MENTTMEQDMKTEQELTSELIDKPLLVKTLEVARNELVSQGYAEGTGIILMIDNRLNQLRA